MLYRREFLQSLQYKPLQENESVKKNFLIPSKGVLALLGYV